MYIYVLSFSVRHWGRQMTFPCASIDVAKAAFRRYADGVNNPTDDPEIPPLRDESFLWEDDGPGGWKLPNVYIHSDVFGHPHITDITIRRQVLVEG